MSLDCRPAGRQRRRVATVAAACAAWALMATPTPGQPPPPPADTAVVEALRAFLADRVKDGFSGVVLVARGDTILLEQGYGFLDAARTRPVAANSVFTTGSITKQFTAAAILKLETLGVLSTSDRLSRHLAGVPADKQAITLHHLLTHRAGFPAASGDDLEPIGRDAFVRLVLGRPLAQPIGTYEYSNVGYSLLAAVVERVSKQPYERFVTEQLFQPAGMRDTGYSRPAWDPARLARAVNDDGTDRGTFGEVAMPNGLPGWHLLGNGGILSTTRDMFRWHLALTGTTLLSEAAKAKLFRPWVDEGGGSHYGYGWSIEDTPFGRLVTHNGGNPYFFADFLRYTDSGVTVYYATNSRDRAMRRLGRPLAQIAHVGRVLDAPARRFTAAPSDSVAVQLARRFVEALTADAATRRSRVAELFSAGLIERRGTDALIGLFDRVGGDVGSEPPAAIEHAVDAAGAVEAVRLRYATGGGGALLILVLDRTAPAPRIDAIELERGR
jgi:CubicO group peptidase (beta-lactamase class C family)